MRDIITGQMSSWFSLQAGGRPLKRREIKSTSLLLMVLLALMVTACGKNAAKAGEERQRTGVIIKSVRINSKALQNFE